MTFNLVPSSDLTLIFERDEVREALAGHCAKSHGDEGVQQCEYCLRLIVILGQAIVEWLAIVDQDRAGRMQS
jgi:hypothetical protein